MHRIACSPVLELFDSLAEILDDWSIDGFEFATRSHDSNETCYPVNCRPELRLALPQCLVSVALQCPDSLQSKATAFRRLPGVKRYLVAEIHVRGAARRAKLEELVAARMGVSPSVWQSLPLVDLPETTYQPSVPARLVVFDDDESAALPAIRTEGERPRKHRRHAPLEHEFSE